MQLSSYPVRAVRIQLERLAERLTSIERSCGRKAALVVLAPGFRAAHHGGMPVGPNATYDSVLRDYLTDAPFPDDWDLLNDNGQEIPQILQDLGQAIDENPHPSSFQAVILRIRPDCTWLYMDGWQIMFRPDDEQILAHFGLTMEDAADPERLD